MASALEVPQTQSVMETPRPVRGVGQGSTEERGARRPESRERKGAWPQHALCGRLLPPAPAPSLTLSLSSPPSLGVVFASREAGGCWFPSCGNSLACSFLSCLGSQETLAKWDYPRLPNRLPRVQCWGQLPVQHYQH